jgi:hypothetical protein
MVTRLRRDCHGLHTHNQGFDLIPIKPYGAIRQQNVWQAPLPGKPLSSPWFPPEALVQVFRKKQHTAFLLINHMKSSAARIAFARFSGVWSGFARYACLGGAS